MKSRFLLTAVVALGLTSSAYGQDATTKQATPPTTATAVPAIVITANSTPADLAKAALQAQGGEKFRNMQNVLLRGSAQLYAPNSIQSIPGSFSIVTSGDKLRMDIDARPAFVFKQIYDGQSSYSHAWG